jgi:hypothetical protein
MAQFESTVILTDQVRLYDLFSLMLLTSGGTAQSVYLLDHKLDNFRKDSSVGIFARPRAGQLQEGQLSRYIC